MMETSFFVVFYQYGLYFKFDLFVIYLYREKDIVSSFKEK